MTFGSAFLEKHIIRFSLEKKTQCKRLNLFSQLTGTVFSVFELVKIGLLNSGQETLTSTTQTSSG